MIYFDHNATTPVASEVLQAMLPYFGAGFGNASSLQHLKGRAASDAVDRARSQVAGVLDVESNEIVFTSGATEACNLAIKGVSALYRRKGNHMVVVRTEHKAVLDCVRFLQKKGTEVTFLDVDQDGLISLDDLNNSIREDTVLVAAMWANNETGVIQPMEEIGKICAQKGTILFSDATQAVGKIGVKPRPAGVQLLAMSAHKCYGPQGVGALYISSRSPRIKLQPSIHGGGHEGGTRSGTLNVPGIVGLGSALELAESVMPIEAGRLSELRDSLEKKLLDISDTDINSRDARRLAHVTNMQFRYVDGEALMATFQRSLAVASGSACTSADPDPSHVLQAMGLSREATRSSLRFSLGRMSTLDEVDEAVRLVSQGVERLREQSPAWKMYKSGLI